MDSIVFDIEISRTVAEAGGWDATHRMGVGVACVWEDRGERMRIYGPDDVPALRDRILSADRITGLNSWLFDFPVLWEINKKHWPAAVPWTDVQKTRMAERSNDLLRRMWKGLGLNPDQFSPQTHGGLTLERVAAATLGSSSALKLMEGKDAPIAFQRGEIQKVANYCADDVALTRDLMRFCDAYGYLINPKTGDKVKM